MDQLLQIYMSLVFLLVTVYGNQPPKFSRRVKVINLREEEPIGTHLLNAVAYDADGDQLEYSIGDRDENYVQIDSESGVVTTASVIDREKVVLFVFKILARQVNDSNQRCEQKVYVHIIDINDNPPEFTQNSYHVNVSEDTGSGVYIIQLEAHDKDGDNLVFSITQGNNLGFFEIEESTGLIRTARQLDYETQSRFNIVVSVKDINNKRTNQHTVTTRVYIGIIDEDDIGQAGILKFVSHFSPEITIVYLKEEQPIGTYLLTASPSNAVDPSVEFSLCGAHKDYFWIDYRSGYTTTTQVVDREKIEVLKFEIVSSKVITKRQVSVQSILVHVVDINDHAPTFTKYRYYTNVSENVDLNTLVTTVSASDKDSSDTLIYSITRGNKHGYFSLDLYSGEIRVTKKLDYERISKFHLQVAVTDVNTKGVYSHTAVAEVYIDIDDEKEDNNKTVLVQNHVPQFDHGVIVVKLEEEQPAGKYLFNAIARDPDGDAIEYSLAGEHVSYVWIDHRSGYLTTTKSIDREQIKKLKFKIIASEVNNPSRRSEQSVIVHILDINDNRPIFRQTRYGVKVSENTGSGNFIVKVSAKDADRDVLLYAITSGNANDFFVIDKLTGAIRTAKRLDYETQARFKLQVTVLDGKKGSKRRHIAIASVYVYLIDEDESKTDVMINNIPTFSSDINVIDFKEEEPKGTTLMTALAKDADGDLIQYAVYGKSSRYVEIEPITGVIKTTKRIDHETIDNIRFNIIAYELNRPKVQSVQSVIVRITDVNDNVPLFEKDVYSSNITENIGKGQFVTKVAAKDNDTSDELLYSITKGNELGFFVIELYTGVVTTAKDLNYETQAKFVLEVSVTDSDRKGNEGHTVTTNVYISVIDEDKSKTTISNNVPKFSRGIVVISLKEEQSIGTFLHKAIAADQDGDKIEFSLLGNLDDYFRIDKRTGTITTAQVIDREKVGKFLLKVVASEVKTPFQKSEQALIVHVIDVNDNAPVFKKKRYLVNVSENVGTGSKIVKVTATDVDVNDKHKLVYSITTGNELRFFAIDIFNGTLSTAKRLDYQRQSEFDLQVSVTDNCKIKTSRHAALTNVHITISNEQNKTVRTSNEIVH